MFVHVLNTAVLQGYHHWKFVHADVWQIWFQMVCKRLNWRHFTSVGQNWEACSLKAATGFMCGDSLKLCLLIAFQYLQLTLSHRSPMASQNELTSLDSYCTMKKSSLTAFNRHGSTLSLFSASFLLPFLFTPAHTHSYYFHSPPLSLSLSPHLFNLVSH